MNGLPSQWLKYKPILAVAFVVLLQGCAPPLQDYRSAAADIMANDLVGEDAVVVRLPQKWEHLAVDKVVYITHGTKGDCIVFRTARGKGGDFEGYLYTRAPGLKKGDKLEVISRLPTKVGKIEVSIRSVLDTNWYSIGTAYLN